MFRKILISVPMEQFPELAINRAKYMEQRFGSEIILSYVIEDNVFDQISGKLKFVMTEKESERFEKEMVKTHREKANKLVRREVERILEEKLDGFTIEKGIYFEEVIKTIKEQRPDLILMEYNPFDMLHYRILDRCPIPVWVERESGPIKKIGLFCTNLAPNVKAPAIARRLGKRLDAEVKTYFIKDGREEIDGKEPDRVAKKNHITWNEVVEDKVESFIYRKVKKEDFDLIIVGRIKRRKYLHFRSKFAKKTKCSVLLVN